MYGTVCLRDETDEKPNMMAWHPKTLQLQKGTNIPGLERIEGGGGVKDWRSGATGWDPEGSRSSLVGAETAEERFVWLHRQLNN